MVAGRIVVGARACNACSGTPRCAVVASAAFAWWLTTSMSMTVRILESATEDEPHWSPLGKRKDWPDAGFAGAAIGARRRDDHSPVGRYAYRR